mgnify:CR=1 FL=1
MKIVHTNTWTIAADKRQQTKDFVREVQQYWNKRQPNVSRTWLISMTGTDAGGKLTLITQWDSLSQWEKSDEERRDEPEWRAFLSKWANMVVPDSREFTVHEVVT